MSGFVDVSNMSDLEVKRMGQMDDADPRDNQYSYRNLSRRNPYGYNKSNRPAKPAEVGYSVGDVWAAACAANRVNGGYFKEHVFEYTERQAPVLVKQRNRDLMREFLANPDRILVEDVEQGEQCRNYLEQDITFRALKNKLTDFDNSTRRVLAVKDRFYTVSHNYELAVVACLPASFVRSQTRASVQERLAFCKTIDANVNDKVTLNVEVVESNYSQKFNLYWTKAVTAEDTAVIFSSKEKFDVGSSLTIRGNVKAHRDNVTQLNYVKVL